MTDSRRCIRCNTELGEWEYDFCTRCDTYLDDLSDELRLGLRRNKVPKCTSCGSPIPKGQGKSCSMCYGDIAYGRDGYYEDWARRQERDQEREDE